MAGERLSKSQQYWLKRVNQDSRKVLDEEMANLAKKLGNIENRILSPSKAAISVAMESGEVGPNPMIVNLIMERRQSKIEGAGGDSGGKPQG